MTSIDAIEKLLFDAAQCHARINNPYFLETGEEALDAVRDFMAIEENILALGNAQDELQTLLITPLDESGQIPNHAMMAGLILARSGLPFSGDALLHAASGSDVWCSTQARLNLDWLMPMEATAKALIKEIAEKNSTIPLRVIIEALIHQRREQDIPVIEDFIIGEHDEAERSLVLATYVGLFPERGLGFARNLQHDASQTLATTALGLLAVYGNGDAYHTLLNRCHCDYSNWHTALHWLGRTAQVDGLPHLIDGLSHPDSGTRIDVLISLAWLGQPSALQAVVKAMDDSIREVSDQAVALIIYWLGDKADMITQTWEYDVDGRLAEESRQGLARIANDLLDRLEPGKQYVVGGEVLEIEYLLDNLYMGVQPEHSWYHWVSLTGAYGPFDTHMDILYNYPTLEKMEDWLLTRSQS